MSACLSIMAYTVRGNISCTLANSGWLLMPWHVISKFCCVSADDQCLSYVLHTPKQWCLWCRYAIASYLLQSKDRHNGNILIDTQGRLVHIDFGFILEISPGANMRFESAAFKLSHEMTQLLDPSGQRDSSQFHMFEELCVRGFLAVRV